MIAIDRPNRHMPLWLGGALAALVAAGSAAALIPPPPPQAGVDCSAKVYAVDTIVCENPDLLAMDQAVQRETIDAALAPAESALFEAHDSWFRRRGLCAMVETARECVAAAYSERLAILKAIRTNATSVATEMTCSPAPWKGSVRASVTPEWIALSDENGTIQAVAVPIASSGWRPVLGIVKSNARKLELNGANGTVRCRRTTTKSR